MITIEEESRKRDSRDMAKSMLQLSFNRRAGARVDGMGSTHASEKEFGAVTTPFFGHWKDAYDGAGFSLRFLWHHLGILGGE
jgi:hypothetical protein